MKVYCDTPVVLVPISELKLNPENRNKHPKEQIERLAKILAANGWRYPVKVSNLSGMVSSGHGRVEAALLNGWTQVPVQYQDYESSDLEYADSVADNAIASWAELDLSGINDDLKNLGPDLDIELLGMKDFTLEVADKFGDPDAVPEPPVEPKTKLGDLWTLGNHRLLCGDSTSIDAVEKLMNGEKADMVFTDPPYGVNYDGGHADKEVRREKLANDDSTEIYNNSVPMMFMHSKPKAALYLWFAATKSLQVLQVLQVLQDNDYEIRSWLIWNKNMAQFGAIGAQYKQKHEPCIYAFKSGNAPFWDGPTNEVSVWDCARASKNEYHPTQKPVELSERAIRNSCPRPGVILDLFGGSGATMIGAESTGRSARLMEISPAYCDVILQRWATFSGGDPIRDDGVTWSSLQTEQK